MKRIAFIFSLIVILSSSCTDLDVIPKNDLLENVAFEDETAYTAYLAKLYASYTLTGQEGPAGDADITIIPDEGFSSYLRAYWKAQELTTDEAVIRWTDAGIQDMNTHTWSSNNQFIRVLYYRIFYTISLCNDFLRVSSPEKLDSYGHSTSFKSEVAVYRYEARFLRALSYWHALDLYRNIALVDRISTDLPSQASPEAVYNFIIAELTECIQNLPDGINAEYARASSDAARMLRAKLALNAPVYLTNPPSDIYNQVVEDMNEVILGPYSLETNFLDIFKSDNDMSSEIIWAMTQDGTSSQSWGGTTFLVNAMVFTNTMEPADWGVASGWSGVRVTPEFIELFKVNGILDTTDSRNVVYTSGRVESMVKNDGTGILDENLGYVMPKFSNLTSTGDMGSHGEHSDTDYPYFRLADAYLMYAEAVLRGATNGDRATAVGYINQLRQRAYGDNSADITDGDLTLNFILDERGRELYYEATRRVDMIRFNVFSSRAGANEKLWEWKGNTGEGQSISPHLEIFPIPASDLGVNGNLNQNPGY